MRSGLIDFLKWLPCFVLAFILTTNTGNLRAEEIVVAQVAPFAGNLAGAGRDFNLGAMLCFDEANARGGIHGSTIRLVSRDDGNKPEETARLFESIAKTENPVAFIGLISAEGTEALIQKGALEQVGAPVVGIRSGSGSFRNQKMLFHLRPSNREEAEAMGDQLLAMGIRKIAVFYEDNSSGLEGLAGFEEVFGPKGLTLVAKGSYQKGSIDVAAAVDTIGKAGPAAVVMLSSTVASTAFIKGFSAAGHRALLMTGSSTDAEQLHDQLGTELARGVAVAQVVPSPYRRVESVAADFQRLATKIGLNKARVNFASLEGYLTARVVLEALKLSGRAPTRAALVSALESMKNLDVGGFLVDFSTPQHRGSRYVELSVFGAGGRIFQ